MPIQDNFLTPFEGADPVLLRFQNSISQRMDMIRELNGEKCLALDWYRLVSSLYCERYTQLQEDSNQVNKDKWLSNSANLFIDYAYLVDHTSYGIMFRDSITTDVTPAIEKLVRIAHNCSEERPAPSIELNPESIDIEDIEIPEGADIRTLRIRAARNLKSWPFPHEFNQAQREQYAEFVSEKFAELLEVLDASEVKLGQYKDTDTVIDAKITANDPAYQKYDITEDVPLVVAGMARNWGECSIVRFMDYKGSHFFFHFGEEDHIRVSVITDLSKTKVFAPKDILTTFTEVHDAIGNVFGGYKTLPGIGYYNVCPSNCGTGIRFGCRIGGVAKYFGVTRAEDFRSTVKASGRDLDIRNAELGEKAGHDIHPDSLVDLTITDRFRMGINEAYYNFIDVLGGVLKSQIDE